MVNLSESMHVVTCQQEPKACCHDDVGQTHAADERQGECSLECATVIRLPDGRPQQSTRSSDSSAQLSTASTAVPLPQRTRSRAEVTMLRSLTPHVTLWRCAQIRLLQLVWPVLLAVTRAAGAGAVHAHDSYLVPSWPPLWPWTLFMRMESFPILLLAVHRIAVGRPIRPSRVHEHSRNPRAYNNCRNAGLLVQRCTSPRHIHAKPLHDWHTNHTCYC